MYKSVKNTEAIKRYIEGLSLHTSVPTVHYEENTRCISVVEDKRVDLRVKHIEIHVYFLQEKFENYIFVKKYEKSSVIPEDICTKPCIGPIIRRRTKWMTLFRLYPTSVTEHYQLMILYEFVAN